MRHQNKSRNAKPPDRLKAGGKNTTTASVAERSRVIPPAGNPPAGNPAGGKRKRQKAATEDALDDAASSVMTLDVRAPPSSRRVDKPTSKTPVSGSVPDTSGRNEDSGEEEDMSNMMAKEERIRQTGERMGKRGKTPEMVMMMFNQEAVRIAKTQTAAGLIAKDNWKQKWLAREDCKLLRNPRNPKRSAKKPTKKGKRLKRDKKHSR